MRRWYVALNKTAAAFLGQHVDGEKDSSFRIRYIRRQREFS
jgi:hypothetical protein